MRQRERLRLSARPVPSLRMKTPLLAILLAMNTALTAALATEAPAAPREPKDVSVHGERRIDD